MKKKNAAERFKLLQEGVARYPFSAELHYGLGREYQQRAQLDSALVHCERVLVLDAELARKTELTAFLAQAYARLATQSLKQAKLPEALQFAQYTLRFEASNTSALQCAALATYQLKQYDQAIAYGLQLLKLQATAQSYNNLAAAYEAQNDFLAALQNYEQAVTLDPALADAQKNLQRVQARLAEMNAKPAQKETTNKNLVKAKSSERITLAQKTKPNAPAQSSNKLSASAKMPKATTRADIVPKKIPLAKLKIGAPRARTLVSQLATLPKAPAPPAEWNTVQTNERAGPALLVWAAAALALILIVWRSFKHRTWQAALGKARRFFVNEKTVRPARSQKAIPASTMKMNEDDVRMLRRIEEHEPLLLAATTAAETFSPSIANPPLLSPERVRGALPPTPSPQVAITPKPQIGLQTEMLFAEMIAATPEAFESTNLIRNEAAQTLAKNNGASVTHNIAPARANGVSHLEPMSDTPHFSEQFHANPATAFTQTPQPAASSGVVAWGEVPSHEALPNLATPQPLLNAAHAVTASTPPEMSSTPPHTATRTLALPALTVQRIGRYIIEKELAQGMTGKIYKAWDQKLDRIVVLKTVQYGLSTSPAEIAALKDRIYREARAIAKLSHPNIVIVYDVDDQPEFSFLVMEYLEGHDLKQVLEKEHRLDCARALELAAQVCSAMEYAHRAGVFHRDLKPSNIMLLDNEEVKVMDFGIAKISNYLSLTQTGRVLGTPSYMAPEQIEGHATDGRADLFSLGVVLYELLIGKRPFLADSLAALAYKIVHKTHMPPSLENVELPMAVDEVINRMLAKRPEERYQNAAELRAALLEVRAHIQ